ncbi:DUF11 domain-containing protein [Jiangella anatolica]|uniref:DUF11 domain-containing protein n=1 Tax=Jiangella anatolica TaxID=2670374 RepID=A0A2W2CI91_9ACTN|nr:DUF11 domain-containing protein [Jiangella anatolica]PZF79913.1 hypothetical protein C1I92_28770 [Jiangella anatolica]
MRRFALLTVGMLLATALPLPAATADPAGVVDGFGRADGPLGVSDSGHAWVDYRGSSSVIGQSAALGTGYALAAVTADSANVEAAITVTQPAQEQWLVVRLSGGGDYWRFGRVTGTGSYTLQLIRGDQLADGAVQHHATVAPAAGDRLSCSTTTEGLHCKVNGTSVASTTHGYNATARGVGIAGWNSSDGRVDDLAVTELEPPEQPEQPPVPAGALVYDDFGGSGVLAVARTGQPWVAHAGVWSAGGGRASPALGYALVSADAGRPDVTTRTVLAQPADEFWLIVRFGDAGNYWRFGRSFGGAYTLQLVANNQLASPALVTSGTVSPAAGDVLSCTTTAAAVACSVNGNEVVRSADPRGAAATGSGLAAWNGTAAALDDFLVTAAPASAALTAGVDLQGTPVAGQSTGLAVTVANPTGAAVTGVTAEVELSGAASAGQLATTDPACAVTSATTLSCALGAVAAGADVAVAATFTPAIAGPVGADLTVTATGLGQPVTASDQATVRAGLDDLVVFDDFERTGGSGIGHTVTEHPWQLRAGSAVIDDGQLRLGAGYTLATVDSDLAESTTTVDVVTPDHEFWLIVRASDAANYWRFGRVQNGAYTLQKIQANTLGNPVLDVSRTVSAQAGDVASCTTTASTIACSVNGEPVVSSDDTFNHQATGHGVAAYQPAGLRFDDFAVVEVPTAPDVAVRVAVPSSGPVGGSAATTVTVRNNGTATAAGIELTGSAGATIAAVDDGSATCQTDGADLTCAVPELAPGATAAIELTLDLPDQPGDVTVTAAATIPGGDGTPSDNTHSRTIKVRNPVAPGAGGVTDAFERPDQSGLGSTETGETWRTITGAAAIEDGQARAAGGAATMAVVDTDYAFGTFEVTWPAVTGQFWTIFRVVDENNYYRFGPDPGAGGYYRVQKVVDGQPQGLAFGLVRRQVQPAPGDVVRIVQRPDDSIFISVNGDHVIDAGDQFLMDETSYGVAFGGAGVRADDLLISSVTATFPVTDDFGRADGPDVGVPTSGVRYPWHRWRGHEWSIAGGELYNSAGDYGVLMLDTSSEAADVAVTVTEATGEFGVVHRFSESGTFLRFGSFGGAYGVQRITGYQTAETPAGLVAHATVAPADGQRLEVRQQLDGGIEYYVDDVLVFTLDDTTTNPRGGHYGLTASSDDARFDDFAVVPREL